MYNATFNHQNLASKSQSIVQVEYDPFYQINVDLILSNVGLSVTAKAGNKHELERIFTLVLQKKLTPDVVILGEDILANATEAAQIAAKFKQLVPAVKLIDYTVAREEKAEWADAYAVKSGLDQAHTIIKALTAILNVEIKSSNEDVDSY